MKVVVFLYFFFLSVLLISCQREVDNIPVTHVDPIEIDSTPVGSLIRFVSVNPRNDSVVSNYQYNAKGSLIKAWSNDDTAAGYTKFIRNDKEKITKIESTGPKVSAPEGNSGGTVITDIFYADNSSGKIMYTITYRTDSIEKRLDSVLYTYENDQVSKLFIYDRLDGKLTADYIYTYSYDSQRNVLRMNGYKPNEDGTSVFNIGYEFVYDNHLNPLYFPSDVPINAWFVSCPNNVVKTSVYYDLSGNAASSIEYQYTYGADGKPVSFTQAGTQIETYHYYYYYK